MNPVSAARQRAVRCLPFLALVVLATPATAAPAAHQYRVAIEADLSEMRVEARFAEAVDSVTAKSKDAGSYLLAAEDCEAQSPIRLRNRRMMLPSSGIRCMSYSVDLAAAAARAEHNRALAPGNVIVSPSLWMWRPRLTGDAEIHVRFVLPPSVRVELPWQRLGSDPHSFRLRASPESAHAPAVIGDFPFAEVEVPGSVLRVSMPRPRDSVAGEADPAALTEWIRRTASRVTLAYGEFPNPSPQVVVIPVISRPARPPAAPVPFARVIRDGGETIELYVDATRSMEALLGDGTATHEFSHLLLPYVEYRHRWISEGFAQYYQHVLLARSGTHDRHRAWQQLHAGFEQGRRSRPELSPNDATAGDVRNSRMKIYWSGAAIALMADVSLRERSGGRETLDDVLARLRDCCLPSERAWSGPELFAKLDALAGAAVFMPLYRRYADTAGFPDTRPLFERLGLSVTGERLEFRNRADLAHIRSAITAPETPATAARRPLAAR